LLIERNFLSAEVYDTLAGLQRLNLPPHGCYCCSELVECGMPLGKDSNSDRQNYKFQSRQSPQRLGGAPPLHHSISTPVPLTIDGGEREPRRCRHRIPPKFLSNILLRCSRRPHLLKHIHIAVAGVTSRPSPLCQVST
jgi:hypothetical protein